MSGCHVFVRLGLLRGNQFEKIREAAARRCSRGKKGYFILLVIVFILVSKKELRMPGQRFYVTGLRLYLGYVL